MSKLDYDTAIANGVVKHLRLASLAKDGSILVDSVDFEFTDEYFANVGICSYTWGFKRINWFDKETGLTWEISDRAEAVCRAALKYFERVWIDGLCMVQVWPQHIGENMKFMGKLYYHATVVPEMVVKLSPEYCLRGWVQQEISYTNILYVIKPLQDFVDGEGKEAFETCRKQQEIEENGGEKANFRFEDNSMYGKFTNVINESIPYFVALLRITEGRESEKARGLQEKIQEFIHFTRRMSFMYGSFGGETVQKLVTLSVDFTGRLAREDNREGVLRGALQSFRTGFFRFNSDRITASFSLAEYVLDKNNNEMMETIDSLTPDTTRETVCINANPGRWSTGLAPIKELKTVLYHVNGVKIPEMTDQWESKEFGNRKYMDLFFSIIYNTTEESLAEKQYVIGYEKLEGSVYSVHLGIQPNDGGSVCALVSCTFPTGKDNLPSDKPINPILSANQHFKVEFGSRAIALLNSSYKVFQMGSDEYKLAATTRKLDMLDYPLDPPQGEYFTPIRLAMKHIVYALGAAATLIHAEDNGIKADVEATIEKWGAEDYRHVDL